MHNPQNATGCSPVSTRLAQVPALLPVRLGLTPAQPCFPRSLGNTVLRKISSTYLGRSKPGVSGGRRSRALLMLSVLAFHRLTLIGNMHSSTGSLPLDFSATTTTVTHSAHLTPPPTQPPPLHSTYRAHPKRGVLRGRARCRFSVHLRLSAQGTPLALSTRTIQRTDLICSAPIVCSPASRLSFRASRYDSLA